MLSSSDQDQVAPVTVESLLPPPTPSSSNILRQYFSSTSQAADKPETRVPIPTELFEWIRGTTTAIFFGFVAGSVVGISEGKIAVRKELQEVISRGPVQPRIIQQQFYRRIAQKASLRFGLVVATWMGVQKYLAWRRGVDDWLNYLPAGFFMGLIYSLPGGWAGVRFGVPTAMAMSGGYGLALQLLLDRYPQLRELQHIRIPSPPPAPSAPPVPPLEERIAALRQQESVLRSVLEEEELAQPT